MAAGGTLVAAFWVFGDFEVRTAVDEWAAYMAIAIAFMMMRRITEGLLPKVGNAHFGARPFESQRTRRGEVLDLILALAATGLIFASVQFGAILNARFLVGGAVLISAAFVISQFVFASLSRPAQKTPELAPKRSQAIQEIFTLAGLGPVTVVSEKANPIIPNSGGAGILRTKDGYQVLVDEKLLESEDIAILRAILAHEACHVRRRDDVVGQAMFLASGLISLAMAISAHRLLRSGLGSMSLRSVMTVVFTLAATWFLLRLARNTVSRRMEIRCDEFSVGLTGDPRAAVAAIERCARDGLAIFSAPWFVVMEMSHPPLNARIRASLKAASLSGSG